MIRRSLGRTVLITLVAAVLVAPMLDAPRAGAANEPVLTFVGGGWGHGIGMSQYGAYGRAVENHTYRQILDFYYDGTTIEDLAELGGTKTVDVLLTVRDRVAVSTPVVGGAVEPGWKVEVRAGDTVLVTTNRPVEAVYRPVDGEIPAHWSVVWVAADATRTEVCDAERCAGVALTIERKGGSHVVLEEQVNGTNVKWPSGGDMKLGHGTITLHPAGMGGATTCGTGQQFCIVNSNLLMDEYLYGLAEVPSSWPMAALKAQAVAGRSYAATRARDRAGWAEPFDVYASTRDQAYTGWDKATTCTQFGGAYKWCTAVDTTSGQVVAHAGSIATTFYSSSNGGHTASPPDVWSGGTALPYLRARPDPFDDNAANPNGNWVHSYTVADVSRWLRSRFGQGFGELEGVVFEDVPRSGRVTFADATIHGSGQTIQVSGWEFFTAVRDGCQRDAGCAPLLGPKFVILSFLDVAYGAYYYVPVQWMTAEGLTTGVAPTLFGPDRGNTRAMIATFLWRFAGEPAPDGPHGFTDVAAGSFYETAVAWMAEHHITTGTGTGTTFSPDMTITRAEAATFLWRFAGEPAPNGPHGFTDIAAGSFYETAVAWMAEHHITTGTGDGTTFSPGAPLTRAQIATFLWRLAGAPEAFADGVELPEAMRVS